MAKDFIDDGNPFNVEFYSTTYGEVIKYWSTTIYINSNNHRRVSYIELKNGNYVLPEIDQGEIINKERSMRGRYVTTRPNNKN